jgi:WD40 repeat protein
MAGFTGTEPSPLFARGGPADAVGASPDAAPLSAPCGSVLGGRATLWGFGASTAQCVLWDRPGGRLVFAAGHVIILQDMATGRQDLLQHHTAPVGALTLSSDGRLLASAAGAPELRPASPSCSLGASPQAAGAPVGGGTADVCVWDLRTGRLERVLRQHGCGVAALAFSPDDGWLVSAGGGPGGGVVLWDLEAGEPLALGRTQGVSRGWRGRWGVRQRDADVNRVTRAI